MASSNVRHLSELVDSARHVFGKRFAAQPSWAAAAPGRVNLIGEHTDYNDGLVMPFAIDRWCVCVGRAVGTPRENRSIICAHDLDQEVSVSLNEARVYNAEQIQSLPIWARYVLGSIVCYADAIGLESIPEVEMLFTSSIPRGGGLSSSAAIEVASAMGQIHGACRQSTIHDEGRVVLARAAQRAEQLWAGVPCGVMDQLASACGKDNHALQIDCKTLRISPVQLPSPDQAACIVIDSGVHHSLADSAYKARQRACRRAADKLCVSALGEVRSITDVDASVLDDEERRCVQHVVSENNRVLQAKQALEQQDWTHLGRVLVASHESLRDAYRVSCDEIDRLVELVLNVNGVYGARMTGGGFGGCVIVLTKPAACEALRRTVPQRYCDLTGKSCALMQVRAVDGAMMLA